MSSRSTSSSVSLSIDLRGLARSLPVLCLMLVAATGGRCQAPAPAWQGTLQAADKHPLTGAAIDLASAAQHAEAITAADGSFRFDALVAGEYALTIRAAGHSYRAAAKVRIRAEGAFVTLTLAEGDSIALQIVESEAGSRSGEELSSKSVSEIPLNKRDFSQLLLLAAGTMTDANGASNFTQQFAINGQRGVEAVFALDGADTSDPEMGGATFSNFNVDAVQELQSTSGVMPAEIGRGAAGFTNIVTRAGTDAVHGSVFEFLRNSALDARNYFDHPSPVTPGRIPPFRRNEFGFTNGGPVLLPRVYDGRHKTYYFVEYQGFRQVLGTTQILPVPTVEERAGVDSTAFPGDPLLVPVNPAIAKVLARYPLPNYPGGTYGPRTYATSSSVTTNADQFSLRLDHQLDAGDHLFARFSLDNLNGPTTNPDQTAIDRSFGVEYVDRQRNAVFTWARTPSAHLAFESSLSVTRTTPSFPTPNRTDPAIKFNDGRYEAFNAAAGSVMRAFGNLFQGRENVSITRGAHAFRLGGEARINRDTTYFGISPNGEYDFGGGTAYSPVDIPSQSGAHTIHAGDPLPDTLSGLLTGSPFAYTVAVAPSYFSNGDQIGPAAINRSGFGAYVQDTWTLSPQLVLHYGLRWELYTPIAERARRTSGFYPAGGGQQEFLINPQPAYRSRRNNWDPRVQLDWRVTPKLTTHAGAALTTIPPNIWQDNLLTGSTPFVIYPRLTAAPGAPVSYGFQITPAELPRAYTPTGVDIYSLYSKDQPGNIPKNLVFDVDRYERDVAALSPDHQITPLNVAAIDRDFGNALLATWSLGVERTFGNVTGSANYVGTAGIKLPRISFPNAYPGASPEFAHFTQFDATGAVAGGFGTEQLVTATSHSSYHALQLSAQGATGHGGPGLQASYTWSRSIDDTSSVLGGSATSSSGAVAQANPQDPFDTHPEKGPSTFDTSHAFSLSLTQDLPIKSLPLLSHVHRKLTDGWELISISSISSGSPFTVYSGLQQTGAGSVGSDRPDQIARPTLSTTRSKREDYFGRGADNASFFLIPTNVPGGTGPNQGRFGTLGRNSFRGPAYYDYDFSLVKDTPLGRRKSGSELVNLQFRSEFFNLFNIVNMGLPSNTILGSGFGQISRTSGNSRQIQFSLKLLY